MNDKAWLILHLKLVDGGDRAVPSHIGVYSESAETLTRTRNNETTATIMSAEGRDYEEACKNIFIRIAYDIRIRGLNSEYRWILPLMYERDAEEINDILDDYKFDDMRHITYELENAGSQPKPR